MLLNWIMVRFYGTWTSRDDGSPYYRTRAQDAFYSDRQTGEMVEGIIRQWCTEQGWPCFDCVVMPSHIHLAFGSYTKRRHGAVLGMIKARITRSLRGAGVVGPERRIWSSGNDRYERLPMTELPRVLAYCAKNRRERDQNEHGRLVVRPWNS